MGVSRDDVSKRVTRILQSSRGPESHLSGGKSGLRVETVFVDTLIARKLCIVRVCRLYDRI